MGVGSRAELSIKYYTIVQMGTMVLKVFFCSFCFMMLSTQSVQCAPGELFQSLLDLL